MIKSKLVQSTWGKRRIIENYKGIKRLWVKRTNIKTYVVCTSESLTLKGMIEINGNYHFNTLLDIPTNWDFYAGLNLGFYFWNSDDDYPGTRSSGLALGGQIGGRYYFSKKFGINLEAGGANAFSGGKFGVTIKL